MPTDVFIKNPREYMKLATETMRNTIPEKRTDKASPLVGAVIVTPDGRVEKACRGEYSEGDHAEYTLLERKLSSVDLRGAVLFCTLEPCAPDSRSAGKQGCAERIVNRRISKVWVGIEDPDPLVDSKGFKYLQDNGILVEMFDRDFQDEIRRINKEFISGAEERASNYYNEQVLDDSSDLEQPLLNATLDDFSTEEVEAFIAKVNEFSFAYKSDEFLRVFSQFGFLKKSDTGIHPTGLGILLFSNYPQVFFPQAVIRATYRSAGRKEDIETFSGSLPKQAKESLAWFRRVIGRQINRSSAERRDIYDYPDDVIRECINNALAHRSWDIENASIYLEISDDAIVIRSPGGPVKPIGMDKMKNLIAPFLSKNPKITYVFEKLRLAEVRGLGFETIRSLPTLHDLPLPVVTFDNPYLNFTFSRAYGNKSNGQILSKSESRGLDYIRLNSPITRKAYEDALGLITKTAGRHLARFVELGLVAKIGEGPATFYEITNKETSGQSSRPDV